MRFLPLFFKSISSGLRSIDIYGKKTSLTMNRKEKYKTALGGFFTLCIIALFLLLFFSFGSDMMYHENSSTSVSEIYSKDPERENFSREKYFFMVGVEDSRAAHFIDNTIYRIRAFNYRRDSNGTITQDIDLERCTEDHLPRNPDLRNYFLHASNSPLDQVFCPKDIESFYIEGAFDASSFANLVVQIYVCKNQTDNPLSPVCKSNEEISKQLSGYFAFYGVDYLIDPQNYESPGQAIGKDYFTPIAPGTTRVTTRFIASTKVQSDDGFLLSSKTKYQYPTLIETKETFLIDNTNSGQLVYLSLRKHHSNFVYERGYKKLQRVLAEIGGFTQIIYLFFWILNYPFARKNYYEKIVNMIYNFESDKIGIFKTSRVEALAQDKSLIKKIELAKKESMTISKESQINAISKENFMRYLMKIKNHLPLKMGYWEYFKSFFFTNDLKDNNREKEVNKYKKIQTAKKAIEEKLDIGYLLKKFYEIDKLKLILFNENQYHLFDYLPKPVILKNLKIDLGNKKSNLSSYESDDAIRKAKKLYLAYQNIAKQQELSAIDKKLIELLDDNVKTLLDTKKDLLEGNKMD